MTRDAVHAIVNAAEAHSQNTGEAHWVGDFQETLQAALNIMTPKQRVQFLSLASLRERVELDGDLGPLDSAISNEQAKDDGPATLFDTLVEEFPGFLEDGPVEGSDLISWVGRNLDALRSVKA